MTKAEPVKVELRKVLADLVNDVASTKANVWHELVDDALSAILALQPSPKAPERDERFPSEEFVDALMGELGIKPYDQTQRPAFVRALANCREYVASTASAPQWSDRVGSDEEATTLRMLAKNTVEGAPGAIARDRWFPMSAEAIIRLLAPKAPEGEAPWPGEDARWDVVRDRWNSVINDHVAEDSRIDVSDAEDALWAAVHTVFRLVRATPTKTEGEAPTGWKLVPIEPTDAMLEAMAGYGFRNQDEAIGWVDGYVDMLASAPEPNPTKATEDGEAG